MNQPHIGKILPAERYIIVVSWDITTSFFQSLTHLYQPLIGIQAIALYQTLLSEFQIRKNSVEQSHHTLMNFLSMPLDEIYKARLKLEAIGLLRTYKKESDELTSYTYQLQQPFPVQHFLADDMLSQLLYHQLGEHKYKELVEAFLQEKPNVEINGENVTANFGEVFDTHAGFTNTSNQVKPSMNVEQKQSGPPLNNAVIDFKWLEQMLTERMIPAARVLTTTSKKLIVQMVVLYDLTEQELESAVVWAVNEDHQLDTKEFKAACLDLFQLKQNNTDIKLVTKKQGIPSKPNKDSQSKEDQFIQMLEQISPKQLLEDLSGGNEASAQDLKLIGEIMSQQGLTPGVINVLVHYVLLKTDMKLTKSYLEKISSHWARKNVKTVRQAMALAKAENTKYQQWGTKKPYYKKTNRKEVVPDWFEEQKKREVTNKSGVNVSPTVSKQTDDISDIAKKYAKKN
ncbi:replication initiation and membrane attachment family protein [Radiobacillus sp. PE A8.2]|uniref:replication initiation and membrane attachment family protein n=1 Tax=Radiobacillus sp. PE A8.2 TaxID=3380349 RepID=UPI00388F55D2